MPREVIVKLWCDACYADDEQRVEGVELPNVTVAPSVQPVTLALCEQHRKELFDPFAEAIREWGQPVGGSGSGKRERASDPVDCPMCGRTSPNRGALRSHVRNQHGTSLAELSGKANLPCPDCGESFEAKRGLASHRRTVHGWRAEDGPVETAPTGGHDRDDDLPAESTADHECPECGQMFTTEMGLQNPRQAMAIHRARSHGVPSANKREAR